MITEHDIRQEKIIALVYEYAAYIRSHDDSYERELQQCARIVECAANLTRYANAIQERMFKQIEPSYR